MTVCELIRAFSADTWLIRARKRTRGSLAQTLMSAVAQEESQRRTQRVRAAVADHVRRRDVRDRLHTQTQ